LGTKVRVLLNWTLDLLSPRSVVQVRSYTPPAARFVHYRTDDRVFEPGNRTDGFYTVVSGEVELAYADDVTGKDVITTIGSGGHFGERLILGHRQRSGTVRALSDAKIMVIERREFLKFTEGLPFMRDYFQKHMKDVYGIDWSPDDFDTPR